MVVVGMEAKDVVMTVLEQKVALGHAVDLETEVNADNDRENFQKPIQLRGVRDDKIVNLKKNLVHLTVLEGRDENKKHVNFKSNLHLINNLNV